MKTYLTPEINLTPILSADLLTLSVSADGMGKDFYFEDMEWVV